MARPFSNNSVGIESPLERGLNDLNKANGRAASHPVHASAVASDDLSGYVRGIVGCEEGSEIRDVLRTAEPLEDARGRTARKHFLQFRLGASDPAHLGEDASGCDAIHVDAARTEVAGAGLRQL